MPARLNPPPAARIVCGLVRRVTNQPTVIASEATEALRDVAARVGGINRRQVGSLGVFPVPNQPLVVIGHACARTPQHFEVASQVSPDSARATTHRIAPGGFGWGPVVDADSGVELTQLLPEVLERLGEDPRWSALGVGPTPDGAESARHWLLTDDGREGELVWGVVHWKAGGVYEGGRVRTWTRDVEGDQARLVGVSLSSVTHERPLVELKAEWASSWNGPDCQAAQRETVDVMYTEKAFGWWLVS